jgi:hypothetical protein
MFGMPDIIVPWFLFVSEEPARGTCSWNLLMEPQRQRRLLGMRFAHPMDLCAARECEPIRQGHCIGLPSDFDEPAHQFPKSRCELFTFAAKSSQPLN